MYRLVLKFVNKEKKKLSILENEDSIYNATL